MPNMRDFEYGWRIIYLTTFIFGTWLFARNQVRINNDDLVEKGTLKEVLTHDKNGSLVKDTVWVIPINASEGFRKSTQSLINEKKVAVQKAVHSAPKN